MSQGMSREENIQQLLEDLNSLEALKRLLYSELNFNRANQSVSTKNWTSEQKLGLASEPTIVATNESHYGGFSVIYCQITDWEHARGIEREVTSVLLKLFPYALFVFSNQNLAEWHFVNIKSSREETSRRLIRRITVARGERLRTASERIAMLDIANLGRDLFGISPLAIQARHDEAFDVEIVTREFFRDYKAIFAFAEDKISGFKTDIECRLFTQKLFNRLMFLVFLERKGWLSLPGMRENRYLHRLWNIYELDRQEGRTGADTFYSDRLRKLFFKGLSTPYSEFDDERSRLVALVGEFPYLNGGLFEEGPDEQIDGITVPDSVFKKAFDNLFYKYNFTVTESTPFDIDVAVDPEMLGKIFEELVTGRDESGSYYTPKAIVAYMGREALKGYLSRLCPKESSSDIGVFVDARDATRLKDAEAVLDALKKVTICDPACGSGAYLLGMMQELLELRQALFRSHKIDRKTVYNRKLEIIQNNIYGVDEAEFAVNIARLRLWLSLIVDYNGSASDIPPLPNLDYKIEVGNSLTGPAADPTLFRDDFIEQFRDLKEEYLHTHGPRKLSLKAEIDDVRRQIEEELILSRKTEIQGFDWHVEFAEVFAKDKKGNFGGFNIVLANPPYVRHERINDLKPTLKEVFGGKFTRKADLFVYFYFRALEILKDGGQLAFISSNKWLRAGYGENLRKELQKYSISTIIDFGDLPLFGAIAYPCIIVIEKTEPAKDHLFRALNVETLSIVDTLIDTIEQSGWNQLQSSLMKDTWNILRPSELELYKKLSERSVSLDKYIGGKAYFGIKTGLTKAYVIDQKTKDRLQKGTTNESPIQPWLRGRDIQRWRAKDIKVYAIAIQNSGDKGANNPWAMAKTESEAERIFQQRFPEVYNHLAQYEEELRARNDQGRFWWELRACAYYSEFAKPKIIYQVFQVRPVFLIDKSGSLANNSIWIIPIEDYFLLGYLNSEMCWFEISRHCTKLQNGYQLIWEYFQNVRVPNANPDVRERIAQIARELSEAQISKHQAELEAELNRLSFQAFGLTEDEIAIVQTQLMSQAVTDIATLVATEQGEE